jgi:hypothetical protein
VTNRVTRTTARPRRTEDAFLGCLPGGAVGDAVGFTVVVEANATLQTQ